jgi:lipoic acid synthetase
MIARRHPEWIRARAPFGAAVAQTRAIVREHRLHTVCEEAQCPNLGECWAHDTATFMLLGDTCTRNCSFCAVAHGKPLAIDPHEPSKVGEAVARLGSGTWSSRRSTATICPTAAQLLRGDRGRDPPRRPECRIEVLVPDFQGRLESVQTVVAAPVDIFNHNVETVPRLYRRVRPGAKYERSLAIIEAARDRRGAGSRRPVSCSGSARSWTKSAGFSTTCAISDAIS